MKYRILKMAVMIGLVASSSLAVAEGRFAYKQPLRGVDEQSNSSIKELKNIAMCKGESKEYQKIYNSSSSYRTYVLRRDNTRKYPGRTDPDLWYLYIDGEEIVRKEGNANTYISSRLESLGYERLNTSQDLENKRDYSADHGRIKNTNYYFSLRKIVSTENYQWCVDNGYETAN